MLHFVVTKEENEERMMIDPSSREDAKVKELLQVWVLSHSHTCTVVENGKPVSSN